ncbi:MAG: transporter substrate-binding domain-containing protein [Desulfonatronovibrio sp.]
MTIRTVFQICVLGLFFFLAPGLVSAEKPVISISTSYKSLLSNPQQTGMLDRIVKEAFQRIGIKAEIVFTPTEKSLVDVNAGLLDGEINRIRGMEKKYPNLVRVPEPNMTMHFVAFASKSYPVDGWESLKDLHTGIVRGWKILEENTRGFPHVTLVPTETELFAMLDKGRIDVALYSKLTGYEHINSRGLTDIRHLEPPLASRDMFLYLNEKHSHLADQVAQALKEMKQDRTYERIVREATSHLIIDSSNGEQR